MSTGRIDVHAHLIPGVDDGCPSLEDSLACARLFVEAGYTHAFCTPHVWPQLQRNTAAAIGPWTASLQREVDAADIPLKLIPGGEINLEWNWPKLGERELADVVTYGLACRYVLVDFWADAYPDFLDPAVRHLQSLGLTVIMAHPERLRAVHDDPEIVSGFIEKGILLQCNTWCLMDPPGNPIRDTSERLLREGRYFLLGTDCHNAATLPIRLEGVRRAAQMVGEKVVNELTITNPRKLLEGAGDHPDQAAACLTSHRSDAG